MNLKFAFKLYDNEWNTIYNSSDVYDTKDLKKLYKDLSGFVTEEMKKIRILIDGKDK